MKIDIVNTDNKKVGSIELSDEAFGGRVNDALIWESVVHTNASVRRGTHKTKNRANVAGSGRKPWKQKGTGRARVGSVRNPLWRHGGTVFGPQPRSYDFQLPRKVKRGAIVEALARRIQDGALVVVDELSAAESKTKGATELLKRLGADGKALLIDVKPDEKLGLAVRNIPGVQFLSSARVGARDVMDASKVIATKAAVEKLQAL
ncbi:MAG TPA: 50S ribosomal protein L4 [Vicinamibacterales bacterium]|jgi:large subunit ribosomal protein L4|nr:50S ribosomal protein L4 [Vicinamibacterales bacterium]